MSKSIRRNQNVFYKRVEVTVSLTQRAMNSWDRLWYCCLCVTGYLVFKTGECSLSLIEQHGFLLHLGNRGANDKLLLRLLKARAQYQPSQWFHPWQRNSDPFSSIKSLSFVRMRITFPEAKTINTTIPTRLFITTFPYWKHKSLQLAKHNSIESK